MTSECSGAGVRILQLLVVVQYQMLVSCIEWNADLGLLHCSMRDQHKQRVQVALLVFYDRPVIDEVQQQILTHTRHFY